MRYKYFLIIIVTKQIYCTVYYGSAVQMYVKDYLPYKPIRHNFHFVWIYVQSATQSAHAANKCNRTMPATLISDTIK